MQIGSRQWYSWSRDGYMGSESYDGDMATHVTAFWVAGDEMSRWNGFACESERAHESERALGQVFDAIGDLLHKRRCLH